MRTVAIAWALLAFRAIAPGPALPQAERDAAPADTAVQLAFLDVGQGDALLIVSPEGRTALVDAGPADAGIVAALRRHGVERIDLAVATHPHADHIGGMRAVLSAFPVRYYMDNGTPHTTSTYRRLLRALSESDVTYLEATPRRLRLGTVRLEVLPPPVDADDHNGRSVGLLLRYGAFEALLTGDAPADELDHFLSLGVPDVELLKASHHGSRDAVSPRWLDVTRPELVVISCGRDNPYGHPHPAALRYYEAVASAVYRTDRHGQVTVRALRDGSYRVRTERGGGPNAAVAAKGAADSTAARQPAGAVAPVRLHVHADAPGNDHHNLNGEYVVIYYDGADTLEIGGWTICDAAAHCFNFPAGARLPPGAEVRLFTGAGRRDASHYYMNARGAVWNNKGDLAVLRDADGRVVATHAY